MVISEELKRVEARLVGSDDDEHDKKIDEQVSKASEGYWKRLEILKAEKERLPKIDPRDVTTIPNWEQYLIEQAKSLRDLIDTTLYGMQVILSAPVTCRWTTLWRTHLPNLPIYKKTFA